MPYAYGDTSRAHLFGVHPDLVRVAVRAIAISSEDFGVYEGLRGLETQKAYVARGVSKTLKSKHLKQPDGFGHAVDAVPWIEGRFRWEWTPLYAIAVAFRQAALDEGVHDLTWGGVWDKRLIDLPPTATGMQAAVAEYCRRHPGPDFIDGPHFQLDRP